MEIFLFMRYTGIVLMALFACAKILNIKSISPLSIALAVAFGAVVSFPLSHIVFLSSFIVLGSVCIAAGIWARIKKRNNVIPGAIIAVGISFGIYMSIDIVFLSLYLIANLAYMAIHGFDYQSQLFGMKIEENARFLIQMELWEGALLLICSVLIVNISKLKRLKSGFVFVQSKKAMRKGMILSISIVAAYSVIAGISIFFGGHITEDSREIFDPGYYPVLFFVLLFFVTIAACLVGIYFWWRKQTTMQYKKRIEERNNNEHSVEMQTKDRQIRELSESNDFLAKVVHRDNKLIPAMYNVVAGFLSSHAARLDAETKMKGESILAELNEIMQERKSLITVGQEYKPLWATGIERVDNILNYMALRAIKKGIQFDFMPSGDIKGASEGIIAKQSLETLLADLIENAITAVVYSTHKKILTTMAVVDSCLEITVQDSGIPFEDETLAALGNKKTTTHGETGGSGIGYITIFEILKNADASFEISQQPQPEGLFTKTIKVSFDGRGSISIPPGKPKILYP